jgi:hypothetical protein
LPPSSTPSVCGNGKEGKEGEEEEDADEDEEVEEGGGEVEVARED